MADQDQNQQEQQPQQISPIQFLQRYPNAPDQGTIELWKQQAPGGRLRLWHSTDEKRVYILRAVGAAEMIQIQNSVPAGITPDKLPLVLQNAIACRCCVWTSATIDGHLTDLALQASGAGLGSTLQEIVYQLSDFCDPVTIDRCSADL
jgi:hypothetical protein